MRFGRQAQEHGVEIAAVGQALLRVEQCGFVVGAAQGQAGDAAHGVAAIALAALHLQRTKAVQGAAVVVHGQAGLVLRGIDVGAAVGDACRWVAPRLQGAQALLLGVVPGVLGEGLATGQRPCRLQALLQALGTGGLCARALQADVHLCNLGAGAGLHLHADVLCGGAAWGRLRQQYLHIG